MIESKPIEKIQDFERKIIIISGAYNCDNN